MITIKKMKSTYLTCLPLLLSLLSGIWGTAQAGDFGDAMVKTTDITIQKATVPLVIEPEILPDLKAGSIRSDVRLGYFEVHRLREEGNQNRIGVRYTPNVNTQIVTDDRSVARLLGQDNAAHELKIAFQGLNSGFHWVGVDDDIYLVSYLDLSDVTYILSSAGEQDVAADTYVLSLDAAIYTD